MKKIVVLILILAFVQEVYPAPFSYLPHRIVQPNGETIDCYVSGDEFYNWIHDKDGYTIIQASDGYFYYAEKKNNKLIASAYEVNKINPALIGVKKWLKISKEEYKKRKERFKVPELKSAGPSKFPKAGVMNNLVIYIRFKDDPEIVTVRNSYDNKLNPTTGISLKAYFQEVSYNALTISSTHYPDCLDPDNTNASYEDSHEREYFQPYNETTNPIGYQDDNESRNREHQLLVDAVTWVNNNSPVDPGLDIDADGDDIVDNVCFMVKGDADGWSDLLWAHRWSLYSQTVYINGKRVYDYTFQPENQVTVSTLCHEMFHSVGAPDLYHYDENYDNLAPVGKWDIMELGKGHMCAYMKWKYSENVWISSIPEITASGTYTLNPLTSATDNCYKIASPNSTSEFFVVEYRQRSGDFESTLPGDGLIVYRINSDFTGNSNFDNSTIFDEVYIYRPSGSTTFNGIINNAYFSAASGRTAINDGTNPSSYLHDGTPGGLNISNITAADATISFDVYIPDLEKPQNFNAEAYSTTQINLSWDLNSNNDDVLIAWSDDGVFGTPQLGTNYSVGNQIDGGGTVLYNGNSTAYNHVALSSSTYYYYKIWSKSSTNEYSFGLVTDVSTQCETPELPMEEGFNGLKISGCWTVELVANGEVKDEPASIKQVTGGTYPTASPVEGTHMIQFNSALCGNGNVMRLISPAFSTVGLTEIPVTFFWHQDDTWPVYRDSMVIQWSKDGITWNNGDTYQRYNTITMWKSKEYILPDEAEEQENVQIAFLFTSMYGYNCYIDKLKIGTLNSNTLLDDIDENLFTLFPNPSNGLFQILSDQQIGKIYLSVYDLKGRKVYSDETIGLNNYILDLTTFAKGVYVLKMLSVGKESSFKLVVK